MRDSLLNIYREGLNLVENSALWWYNLTVMKNNNTKVYYTPIQLKLPVDFEKIIEIDDPVYSFNEVMNHIDLQKYFVVKDYKKGRPGYDRVKLLKIVLFAVMEFGYCSVRQIRKLCKTDIRFMWLLDDEEAPSHMTIQNFIHDELSVSLEEIFHDINSYIFAKESVDLQHAYIDGTKIEANANKYTWVWKKSCLKSRNNVFFRLKGFLAEMNKDMAMLWILSPLSCSRCRIW